MSDFHPLGASDYRTRPTTCPAHGDGAETIRSEYCEEVFMIELELLGIGADGESLVFFDSEGERYVAPITDELRAAARRDRPRIEAAPDPARQALRPRDIQALLRAGATPEDIAARHGMEVAAIARYEAPVAAEKNYALQRALSTTIGSVADGPAMGDLVVDRLAARGVDPSTLVWSAQREANGPWQICLTFIQGAAEHGAHWLLPSSGVLEAVDQEAQWLTETVSVTPAASIFTPLPVPGKAEADLADLEEVRAREAIIDQLNAERGKRQDIEYELDEDELAEMEGAPSPFPAPEGAAPADPGAAGSISARIYSLAQARTKDEGEDLREAPSTSPTGIPKAPASPRPASSSKRPSPPVDAQEDAALDEDVSLPGLEDLGQAPPEPKKSKSRRRSVPSWDEIVFGAKPQ